MSGKSSIKDQRGYEDLDDREREVLQLLLEGKSTKAIAFVIISSERTVDIHVNHILDKLGLELRTDLEQFTP